jgi:hypothetical protein
MPIWAGFFLVGFASMTSAVVLAMYLDFRRMNLVQLGQLPKWTPEIFSLASGGGGIDIPYIFSRELARSPDAGTRRWIPWLRGCVCLGGAMMLAFIVSAFLLG